MSVGPPLVSVVIPTFNRADTLRRAVTSALDQTYRNLEVVVSDNASTDGSLETIEDLSSDPRVRVLRSESNLGPVPNWRKAIDAATGRYIKIVWSDDWMEPNTVDALIQPFLGNSAVGITVCQSTIHTSESELHPPKVEPGPISIGDLIDSRTGLKGLPVSPGAALVQREDALWGTTCAFNDRQPSCRDRAIGPDLLMVYGAFRRGKIGWWVADTQVHFSAGADSITMTEDSNRLRTCYSMALAYLMAESAEPRDRVTVRQILTFEAIRQPWSDTADKQQVSDAMKQLTAGAGPWDWTAGSAVAFAKSTRRAARGLMRRVRQRSQTPR